MILKRWKYHGKEIRENKNKNQVKNNKCQMNACLNTSKIWLSLILVNKLTHVDDNDKMTGGIFVWK